MTRTEKLSVAIFVALTCAFAVVLATGVADWLGKLSWFGNGANVIQWISGPSTAAAVVAGVILYLNRRCPVRHCWRLGEHPVDGTLLKVCNHHHTLHHHRLMFAEHGEKHARSDRLDRGQSHTVDK